MVAGAAGVGGLSEAFVFGASVLTVGVGFEIVDISGGVGFSGTFGTSVLTGTGLGGTGVVFVSGRAGFRFLVGPNKWAVTIDNPPLVIRFGPCAPVFSWGAGFLGVSGASVSTGAGVSGPGGVFVLVNSTPAVGIVFEVPGVSRDGGCLVSTLVSTGTGGPDVALVFAGSILATGIVLDFPDVPLEEDPSFEGFGGSIFAGTDFGDPGAILVFGNLTLAMDPASDVSGEDGFWGTVGTSLSTGMGMRGPGVAPASGSLTLSIIL